jgi:hypothetical protein
MCIPGKLTGLPAPPRPPTYPRAQERFAPGSLFHVKDVTTARGERRTVNFYSRARLDGLSRRIEVLGVKLSEAFTGREDRLEYRSATFGPIAGAGASAAHGAAAAGAAAAPAIAMGAAGSCGSVAAGPSGGSGDAGAASGGGGGERSLAIVKMSEKFGRDPSRPADEDVAKRVFFVAEGRVELRYHLGEGRMTAGYVVLQADGPAQAVQVRACGQRRRGAGGGRRRSRYA